MHQFIKKLDCTNLAAAKVKCKGCFRPLESLSSAVNIENEQVYVNPSILFTRLTAVAQREDDIESYFMYEMSPYPPSLFKDGL